MNYNSLTFWLFFAIIYVVYWRVGHRQQNRLMLVASYLFYGTWDYRFLFLILLSTAIDFIGGLGVAGVKLPGSERRNVGILLIGSALLLCSNVHYAQLFGGLIHGNGAQMAAALPHRFSDFYVFLGTALATGLYALWVPRLYAAPLETRRKYFLVISMVANLGILCYFKYCDFFIQSFVGFAHTLGLGTLDMRPLGIILPAGISFYTFQAMSYTIDVYRNEVQPTDNFADFALFVCFFPHLVAGPIMRAHTLLPQVVNPRTRQKGDIEEGILLIAIGLFKKIVIADNMAALANAVFYRYADHHAAGLSGGEALMGIYAFAFQIYGDFSGYSSIARGISKLLAFDLVINFRMPYLAVSPSDFWSRWHISLSSWLRDYLYIPLGGNRKGVQKTYRNLMMTMLLGGLWHGASWTFVAWGFYHGAILCIFRLLGIKDKIETDSTRGKLVWAGRVLLMFHLTCFGWLLFRADSFATVVAMSRAILFDFQLTPNMASYLASILFYCGGMFALEWMMDGESRIRRWLASPWKWQAVAYIYMTLMLFYFTGDHTYEFIYFQF